MENNENKNENEDYELKDINKPVEKVKETKYK